MQRSICFISAALLFMLSPCHAGLLDDLKREVLLAELQQSPVDNSTISKGLKEALAISTERAVNEVAKTDGYFGRQLIKILVPEEFQQAADILKKAGYQQQLDGFILSMNRAAEKAAPNAAPFFADAIRQMSVENARRILSGGDKAATEFFEKQTRTQLFNAFKPSVAKSMEQAGTARIYKEMFSKYESIPLTSLIPVPSLDLDTYVTNKALDGLFVMVGEEEKKIRTNPAARTSELLRKVFGNR